MSVNYTDEYSYLFKDNEQEILTNNNLELTEEEEEQKRKEEEEEENKTQTYNDSYSYLFNEDNNESLQAFNMQASTDEKVDAEKEPSFARKFDYGLEQEQTILGNLAQSFVAGAKALTRSGLSFEKALRESERQRQEDIFEEYPEFKNRPEDAAVTTGRIAQALVDPIPWLVPWTKIAQVGRAATVTAGAGFAVGDVALREKVLYGRVDPSSVLMAGVFGAGATYGADVIARRFTNKNTIKEIDFVDETGTTKTLASKIKDEPEFTANAAEIDAVEEVGNARLKKEMNSILDDGPENSEFLLSATAKIKAYEELDTAAKITSKLKEFKNVGVNITRKELERQATVLKIEAKKAKLSISSQTQRLMGNIDDGVAKNLEDLETIGTKITLSDGFIRKFVYEATRPIFGGASGAIAYSYMGEEDDTALMWTIIGGSAALGFWQGRVQRSKFLTKPQKEVIKDVLYQEASLTRNTWTKINTAGSHAERLNAWGGSSAMVSKLMYKQQGASLTGRVNMPVESRSTDKKVKLFNFIHNKVLNDVPPNMREDLGKLRNGFVSLDELAKKYNASELEILKNSSVKIKEFTNSLGEAVSGVGIKYKELENYGLTQMWDWGKIGADSDKFSYLLKNAWAVQKYKLDPTDIKGIEASIKSGGKQFEDEVNQVAIGLSGQRATSVFDADGNFVLPLVKNYEKSRVITDQNSRKMLQEFIVNDPQQTLAHLVVQTVPSLEFARTWGANGELLRTVRRDIHNKYNAINKGRNVDKLKQKELQHINDSMNAFFGLYGNRLTNETGHVMMAGLTALGNSTMLTRVSVPSIGDLIQPLQNSGFMPVIKSYASAAKSIKLLGGKQDSFSVEGLGIAHLNVLDSELKAINFGLDPANKIGQKIGAWNEFFFKIVGLKKITELAKARAYDAGVYRAYAISKKVTSGKKISESLQDEINALSLSTEDMRKIASFKNTRLAYDNKETKKALHIAGFNSAERDAITPTVGNRLLFAQSNNPLVRSLGQFLSWAQAKTSQTNALITRIEDGDAALALRMLAALSIYGGVRELQIAMSPSKYYDEEKNVPERGSFKYITEAMRLSGNIMPFQLDKALSLVTGAGASEGLGGAIPSLGLVEDFIKFVPNTAANVWVEGDGLGVVADTMDLVPFGKDLKNILSEDKLGIINIEDAPRGRRKRSNRRGFAEGYEVTNVPYVKENPEERINPRTGEPYTAIYKR